MILVVKKLPANAGDIRDMGSVSGSGRSPGGGHRKNPMDRGVWWATVSWVKKSRTWLKRLSMHTRDSSNNGFVTFKISMVVQRNMNGSRAWGQCLQAKPLPWGCKGENLKAKWFFLKTSLVGVFLLTATWERALATERSYNLEKLGIHQYWGGQVRPF